MFVVMSAHLVPDDSEPAWAQEVCWKLLYVAHQQAPCGFGRRERTILAFSTARMGRWVALLRYPFGLAAAPMTVQMGRERLFLAVLVLPLKIHISF